MELSSYGFYTVHFRAGRACGNRPWRASPLGQARSSWPLCSLERERAVELRIGALRCSLEIVNFLQAGRVEELGAEERSSEVGLKSI